MKTLKKVFIGAVAFFVLLCYFGSQSNEDEFEQDVKISVRMDLEDIAKSKLNYRNTFRSSNFFLTNGVAALYFSGSNAFGVKSTFVLYADVKSNIKTKLYTISNIRTIK